MKSLIFLFFCFPIYLNAQKKPLDHSVYDSWQNIGEHKITNDGHFILYTVTPQEGDAELTIQSSDNQHIKFIVPRGYNASFTEDSRYAVFKIKPYFKDLRSARIKKKRPEDYPKDSLGVLELSTLKYSTFPNIKSYKIPDKSSGWLAFLKDNEEQSARTTFADLKTVDSLRHKVDSLVILINLLKNIKAGNGDFQYAGIDPDISVNSSEGSDLMLLDLNSGSKKVFKNVGDYYFNAYGENLLVKVNKSPKDTLSKNAVLLYDLRKDKTDTLQSGGYSYLNFAMTEHADKIAFMADMDTSSKSIQRFYGLYIYFNQRNHKLIMINKGTQGMEMGMTVSEYGNISFSKSGNRIFFGTAPVPSPKDTSIIESEVARVDIWHYNDDYLQSQQLFQLNNELKRNYLAVYDFTENKLSQLGSSGMPVIIPMNEGDADIFVGITDTGRRVEAQWMGRTKKDVYGIYVNNSKKVLIKKNLDGVIYPSANGKYILWYDNKSRNYFDWDGRDTRNISLKIRVPLFNEENDLPDDPSPYGIAAWHEGDSSVYIYDRYDVWKVDPLGIKNPEIITPFGRRSKLSYRYIRLDSNEHFIKFHEPLFYKCFYEETKKWSIYESGNGILTNRSDVSFSFFQKAKNANAFLFSQENYSTSPNIYFTSYTKKYIPFDSGIGGHSVGLKCDQLTSLNQQQSGYNWGSAELYHWKAFDGKKGTGILYKPEDFDPSKKYPMLIYFYEKLSDGLYNYIPPAPTASRLNISFFVSRGYLVFVPDIIYKKGQPGKDCYNYVVSGAEALAKNLWVDKNNIGIQGQSWGGYQVAYLVTATHMFKAAWAGAPVVNMFSAYGGIRWESGNNRQSQYEKGQSRIGASPWKAPNYIL